MVGIMKYMLNIKTAMDELEIIQRVSKELFHLYIVAMLKQIVTTVVINMRLICVKPPALLAREVD